MNQTAIETIINNIIEFLPLFHKKIMAGFHLDNTVEPKITKNQMKTLFITKRHGKILPSQLGKSLDMKKGSLTTLIDSLENLELVKRERDPQDRRKTWISLTESGQAYLEQRMQLFKHHIEELFKTLTREQTDEFIKNFKHVIETLQSLPHN